MAKPPMAGTGSNNIFQPTIAGGAPAAAVANYHPTAGPGRTHVDDMDELDDMTKQLLGIGMSAAERQAASGS